MGLILWSVIALAALSLIAFLAYANTRRRLPRVQLPPGEKMPRTHLQRYAGWTLLEIVFLTALAGGIIVVQGPEAWWEHDRVRLTVTLILLAALGTYLVFSLGVLKLKRRDDGRFDERDGMIFDRAASGVGGAMLLVMSAWMIGLTEFYNDTHLVPSYFLYLIFWSLVMTNVIASIARILLAYRRS